MNPLSPSLVFIRERRAEPDALLSLGIASRVDDIMTEFGMDEPDARRYLGELICNEAFAGWVSAEMHRLKYS